MIGNSSTFGGEATHCILHRLFCGSSNIYFQPENCICINTSSVISSLVVSQKKPVNNIFIGTAMLPHSGECDYNNYTTGSIPTNNGGNVHSVNNVSTGQTLADYFNYIHPNCLANPTTASVDEWLQCDFTAKPGSANIGRGKNYFYGIMDSEQPDIRNDDFNRPIVETWFMRDELKDFAIVRESTYKADEYNWNMTNQTIKIVEL